MKELKVKKKNKLLLGYRDDSLETVKQNSQSY